MSRIPRVLYLAHRFPFPPDKGDRIRVYNILLELASRAEVWLGCLADEEVSPDAERAIEKLCKTFFVVRHDPRKQYGRVLHSLIRGKTATEGAFSSTRLRAIVADWCKQTAFDAAIVSSSALTPYLRQTSLGSTRKICDLIDVDSQKWFDYAQAGRFPKSWLYRLEGTRLRTLERTLGEFMNALLVVSEAEAQLYRRFGPAHAIHAIPNGVDLHYFEPRKCDEDADSCVFVGAFDYKPNIEGAIWFTTNVWPKLIAVRPNARLRIVGRNPVASVRELESHRGVEVTGAVADVREHVARSAVVIVPLQIARGVQNKLLEGLAMGKAVVSSMQALQGVQAVSDQDLLSATLPDDWLSKILALWADPARRRQLGQNGRRYVESHHSWSRCLEPLWPLLGFGPHA